MICLARLKIAALFFLLCASARADETSAALKIKVQLDGGVIKVADLWDNAGKKASMVIGPAPPPGRSITVAAPQLAYIARLFDVDWKPTSGAERAVVERSGRPLTRDELVECLRRNLTDAGASASATIEFASFAPVMVPQLGFPLLTVEQLAFDPVLEHFTASVIVSSEGMDAQRMRVTGKVTQTEAAVVATRRLSTGDVIAAGDVRIAQLPARQLTSPVASEIAQVVGQSPRRTIVAGQPLSATDIGPPVMVPKGATVVMVVESPGISIAAQGIALDAGGRDDVIQVMNPLSRAVVEARITGPGRAVIAPGSSPVVAPRTVPRSPEVSN